MDLPQPPRTRFRCSREASRLIRSSDHLGYSRRAGRVASPRLARVVRLAIQAFVSHNVIVNLTCLSTVIA